MQNLRREPHSSVTVGRFRKLKSSCYVIDIPQADIPAPTLTVMQGFEAKKKKRKLVTKKKRASCISFPVPAYCITHALPIRESNPGAKVW